MAALVLMVRKYPDTLKRLDEVTGRVGPDFSRKERAKNGAPGRTNLPEEVIANVQNY